jgi:hypothetical protein
MSMTALQNNLLTPTFKESKSTLKIDRDKVIVTFADKIKTQATLMMSPEKRGLALSF